MGCRWAGLFSYVVSAGNSSSLVLTVTPSVWLVYRPHYESVLADYFIHRPFFLDPLVTSSFFMMRQQYYYEWMIQMLWLQTDCYSATLLGFVCLLIDTIHAKLLPPVPNCQSLSSLHPVTLFNRVTWCKGETLTYLSCLYLRNG